MSQQARQGYHPETTADVRAAIAADAFRYTAKSLDARLAWKLRRTAGWRYVALWRWLDFSVTQPGLGWKLAKRLLLAMERRERHRTGIAIGLGVGIGPGLFLSSHPMGIVIAGHTNIGRNCTIEHGVTLGWDWQPERWSGPQIGDEVFIGPGVVIAGPTVVGSGSAIGANSVVRKAVEPGHVVGGVPARVISGTRAPGMLTNLT